MILEGFTIENWSCVRRVHVEELPAGGVVVLHGPNGTGKSSIIQALRATLMDFKANSNAANLTRWFPRNTTEKPRVTVRFRARGTSWRITKQYGSRIGSGILESLSPGGSWKLETDDPSEAHDRARELAGGSGSTMGLHQLLWLTQAEFKLPDPKTFDSGVQSRLRAVLGVLQTPLDDHFCRYVQARWTSWFHARHKDGERPRLKKDCPLSRQKVKLDARKLDLARLEETYQAVEARIQRCRELEIRAWDLDRQHDERSRGCEALQAEHEASRGRIEAHRHAVAIRDRAIKDRQDAQDRRAKRDQDEERIRLMERETAVLRDEVEEKISRLRAAEDRLHATRRAVQDAADRGQSAQRRLDAVNGGLRRISLERQRDVLRQTLKVAEETAAVLDALRQADRDRPAPDAATLRNLQENRLAAARARADLEAATLALTLRPEPAASRASLEIDGTPASEDVGQSEPGSTRYLVRRQAAILIPGWGRIELTRGSESRDVHHLEDELARLDGTFADEVRRFGLAVGDPAALDRLRLLAAERDARAPERIRREAELIRLAPDGLDALRTQVAALERALQAVEREEEDAGRLPGGEAELQTLAEQLKVEIQDARDERERLNTQAATLAREIEGDGESEPGLRRRESAAHERLTAHLATLNALREELDRRPSSAAIDQMLRETTEALEQAERDCDASALDDDERTISDRLTAAREALQAIEEQRRNVARELYELKGALSQAEGLHQERARLAARVDELERWIAHEQLESDAYDRLRTLFETCREKQLDAVLGPVHDRVVRWMRLLRIGGYQSIRFNDQFLPEALLAEDGAVELALDEESTGTIEQIALMVRLALGAMLSTLEEPAVAVLDDPLTHSDVMRLDLMRAVLRGAAAGDPAATPPIGPLQILIFTCHPEWFALPDAGTIDLACPDILTRGR